MPSFETEKAQMRQILSERRNEITPDSRHGHNLKNVFLKHFSLTEELVLAGFWPMATELDLVPLLSELDRQGVTCGLPVVEATATPLIFRKWRTGDELDKGPYGTSHPSDRQDVIEPDMLLIPLLGFDLDGARLGYGGGYYDRTIEAMRSHSKVCCVGVGFDGQQVGCIPTGPYDQKMDWIVTPTRVIQCADLNKSI